MQKTLSLSAIICTYNRAPLLKQVLESLTTQTLSRSDFEIIVIDDGSNDTTREIVEAFKETLPIRYFYQKNAGLAAAKNHGIFTAQGKILLFLDDDDVTMPTLLEEHVKMHGEFPEDRYAVLHHTDWGQNLFVTPLMHFITQVGCFLFSYPSIKHRDILDFTYFWGGRSSCKRSFLIEHGVFNPVFRFGCEDIELGYRLSKQGLRVVYTNRGVSRMIRPVSFDDFCSRLLKQGSSQYVFSNIHPDPIVQDWAEMTDADERWEGIRSLYDMKMRSARKLDKIANLKQHYNLDIDELTRRLLYSAYWWCFKACKIKGIQEAKISRSGNLTTLGKPASGNDTRSHALQKASIAV